MDENNSYVPIKAFFPELNKLPVVDYECLDDFVVVGFGAFGEVYRAILRLDGEQPKEVAVKVLNKDYFGS